MAEQFIDGIGDLIRKIDKLDFSSREQKNLIRRLMRDGGNIIKDEVKSQIPSSDKFEHVDFIRKNVKVVTSKSRKNAGVNVYTKGKDVPVGQGKSRRMWKLQSYQKLVFFGNIKTPGRRDNRGRKHGNVRGITGYNPYTQALISKGNRALSVISKGMDKEFQKQWAKRI